MIRKLLLHNRDQKVIRELIHKNEGISDAHRIEKFNKMVDSPYIFFRGSNHLYWEDFYNDWRMSFFGGRKETLTWINGDAHIYNYGAYANHSGKAIFCMDDFDDSIIADYQFDLWRMAVSIVLDCRENGIYDQMNLHHALREFARAYWKQMVNHETEDPQNEVHLTSDTAEGMLKDFLVKVERKKSREKMLTKWTKVESDKRIFDLENSKVEKLDDENYKRIEKSLTDYRHTLTSDLKRNAQIFEVKDIVARVSAGTGSLGSMRFYALLEGDTSSLDDDVILDIKEQGKPPLYDHMSNGEQKEFDELFPNPAERHALAFQALAEHPDQYLGWIKLDDKFFSVKERSPFKADFPTDKLKKPDELYFMARVWGDVLAMRHKRASYELNEQAHEMPEGFSKLIDGKQQDFEFLVATVASNYADCVANDHKILKDFLTKNTK